MQETLLRRALRIGAEDHLDGELERTGQRVQVEHQSIVAPVELDRGTARALHDRRISEDLGGVATDTVEPCEAPDHRVGRDRHVRVGWR